MVSESKASFAERWLHSLHPESEAEEPCLTLASSSLMEMGQPPTLFTECAADESAAFISQHRAFQSSKNCPFQKVIRSRNKRIQSKSSPQNPQKITL